MSGGIYTTNKTKTLLSLQDVDVENLTNGQALIYDATTETFTNQDIDNELSSISTVANELIKKDGTNTNFVRAHILSTDSSVGPLTKQKTTFINSQPPLALQLSSIESIFDNGFYSMILNPHESNIEQKGMTLKAFLNEVLVGINTDAPAEGLHLLGNFRIDNNTTQSIRFYNIQGSTKEAGRISVDDNGGGADILFLTRPSGGTEPTEKMIIDKTGNVGIGTSTPSQKLQVNGTIRGNNLITEGYLDLNPDGGLEYNAQLRHDKFIGSTKPDQVKMFLRNHNFWTLQEGIGNGGDGTRKMIIDAPLEVNATIKSGISFYVYDILHQRYANSAYEIQPALGWSGNSNTRALLALNQYTAALRVYNDTNAEITSISPYKDGYIYYRGTLWNVSDDRLKSYETDVSGATDMILKLKPKFYKKHPTLITDDPTPDLSGVLNFDEYGFIAQELKEDPQLSHFVRENPETEIYHVNYVEMIPLLVQTIKELNERIKVLESRL